MGRKIQIHKIVLVYPPVSNQEAEWLKNDKGVQDILKTSNLYMIGQRHEAKFDFDEERILDNLELGPYLEGFLICEDKKHFFRFDISEYLKKYYQKFEQDDVEIDFELGDKFFRLVDSNRHNVLIWFTPDILLYYKSINHPALDGLEEYRELLTYHLHYVGISKKNDSLKRLVIQPHDKRLRILSNEHPMQYASRVTDEIMLFFFKIHTLEVTTYDVDSNFDDLGSITGTDEAIIAEAEKAFTFILKSQYNDIQFENYPFSEDGLFRHNLGAYLFFFGESLTFITEADKMIGNYTIEVADPDQIADYILIEGEKVSVLRKGKYNIDTDENM